MLTHWGRVTHICVSKLTSIASDNSLSIERRQASIWNNAGTLLIGPLETNFSEISIEIQIFNLKKIRLKMSSAKCRPFCLGLNVLRLEYLPQKRLDVSPVWYDSFITLKHKKLKLNLMLLHWNRNVFIAKLCHLHDWKLSSWASNWAKP